VSGPCAADAAHGDNPPVSSPLSVEREGDVALVTLDRPEKRNALSIELRERLTEAFAGLASDDGIGCVVLTGAGSAFCAGMDRSEFGGDREHKERLVRVSVDVFRAVGRCPKPVLAAVNGPAVAGGFALALLCDLRIASEDARFGFPELPMGIPPAYAAARAALPAALVRELCLTGRLVDAAEARELGICSQVVTPADLMTCARELAERVAALPRPAVLKTKERILIENERVWGPLFAQEENDLRQALLG
jgi:enoyl-CoA hydratase